MTEKDRSNEYQRRLYDSYVSTHVGATRLPTEASMDRSSTYFRQNFARHLPKDRSASLLDAGCGYGSLVRFLNDEGYVNVIGVDVSREQTGLAYKLGTENVVCADMTDYLNKHCAAFDGIFLVDVLEHLHKDQVLETLDAVAAALKPGGRLVIQTANGDGPFTGRYRYGDFTHELAFTARSIGQVLRATGFNAVAVYPVDPAVHGLKSAIRWLAWRAIRVLLTGYLMAESGVTRGHILSQNLIAVAVR
jgi:2-polyprenyl-3-methyl-5-hydroxy-6-metoxy-1,4-benzoquinol methylase